MTFRDLFMVIVGFGGGALFAYLRCVFIIDYTIKKRSAQDIENLLNALERQGKIVRVAQR